jgi:hypothetical protein
MKNSERPSNISIRSPLEKIGTVRIEFLDPVIVWIGNIDVSCGVNRYPLRRIKLPRACSV